MCTDLLFTRGNLISTRTCDFLADKRSRVQIVPRGNTFSSGAFRWRNTIGYVAMDNFELSEVINDGINESGLSVSSSILGETVAPEAPITDVAAVDLWQLSAWLLGTCHYVEDVRAALAGIVVWKPRLHQMTIGHPEHRVPASLESMSPALHFTCHDARGGSIVVEFLDEGTRIYDNPVGVSTNSPTFQWHLANLRNFVELTPEERPNVEMSGYLVRRSGHGSGLLGLPGDVTPPSRFIRGVVLTQFTDLHDDPHPVTTALRATEFVSVPRFIAASGDHTQWAVAREHEHPHLHVRTYDSWQIDSYDLAELGLQRGERRWAPLPHSLGV